MAGSWHLNNIEKGVVGEFSKVEEEFNEAKDAIAQKNEVLLIVELCDMLGALMLFMERNHPRIGFLGLVRQAEITNRVRGRDDHRTKSA